MKFKVGDKVKVVDSIYESDIGKIGVVSKKEVADNLGDIEGGYILDIQRECENPYFYESELEKIEVISEEEYKKAIDSLMKENKELQGQLEYADKQLEKQAEIILKLEDHAHELHDRLVEEIKGGEIC